MFGKGMTLKRSILVCGFLCLLWSSTSFAQPAKPPQEAKPDLPAWTITVDPLTTALGLVHIQVERAFGEHVSLYVGPNFRLFNGILPNFQGDFLGFGVEVGLRWFPTKRAPFRWWVGVRGVLAHLRADTQDGLRTSIGGYVSILAGYTWLVARWLVLSAGVGVQYLHYQVDGMGVEGVLPALHTNIGVAF
ncbi:MAG: DUF3575 domain-containing protein [Deltaproteobacteria bacterium]|nr:MAG: DUF3575 domain-containing protein [Deltaproteobacteria bacterium]